MVSYSTQQTLVTVDAIFHLTKENKAVRDMIIIQLYKIYLL